MTGLPLAEHVVVVHPTDNVAVVKFGLGAGDQLQVPDEPDLTVTADVDAGHRVALRDIVEGESVLQYGQPIGTSRGIGRGAPITTDNMDNAVPLVRDLPPDLHNEAPDHIPESERATFPGFRRPDGRVGTRNFLLIVPTSMCASHEATQISIIAEYTLFDRERFPNVDGVVAIPHNKGCGCSDGSNITVLLRTLANYADHPNVGGVVFLDLGCEKTNMSLVESMLKERGGLAWDKPTAWIGIQESGGTEAAIRAGLQRVEEMLPELDRAQREDVSVAELVLGVECGGSDGFSGLSANPALGRAADELILSKGTVLLTEVPEFCGAEHVLAHRARNSSVGRAVYEMVDWYKAHAAKFGAVLGENPSPGNVAGGLLNITIKSLGAIAKAGTTRVEGVTDYGAPPDGNGLHLMQGPGYDQESVPGLVAAGATIVVFTTGRGTTIGNAITPVIKLASNTRVFEKMSRDIDLSAGGIIDGTHSIDEIGAEVFERIVQVAGGGVLARAEEQKHREFQVWGESAVSL